MKEKTINNTDEKIKMHFFVSDGKRGYVDNINSLIIFDSKINGTSSIHLLYRCTFHVLDGII